MILIIKMIIHKEDDKKEGYYLCIHAVGKGFYKKLSKDWSKVTCKNCLKKMKKLKSKELSD